MRKTSIIPGLLLLLFSCKVYARHVLYNDDSTSLEPILTQSRRTRICTELCTSGLGGTPCGDSCLDLIPTNLPLTSRDDDGQNSISSDSDSSERYNVTTRADSCDVLCKNRLGYPLCACKYNETSPYATDFIEVCSAFCLNYNYQIAGCQNCEVYKQFSAKSLVASTFQMTNLISIGGQMETNRAVLTIGWTSWCKDACSHADGGAACNCDLLP